MKKNKTLAYMLAATLLVGGTFVGTKALFTDKVEVAGELAIATGDVDIEVVGEPIWERITSGEDEVNSTEGIDFDNLKTGDILQKEITIKNEGTLKAIVNLNENTTVTDVLPAGIDYTATFKDSQNQLINEAKTFEPGEEATITLRIEVTGGGVHIKDNYLSGTESSEELNSDAQEEVVLDLRNSYIIEAEQTAINNN